MKRKAPGFGHIRERKTKDGTIRHQAIVKEKGKQRVLVTGTKAEADAYLAAWYSQQLEEGKHVPADAPLMTVRQLGRLYLDSLTDTTLETSKSRWEARVERVAEFIDWPVSQMGEPAVRHWVDRMCRTPITAGKSAGQKPKRSTVQNSINLLRDVFRYGVIEGHMVSNPATGVTIRSSTIATPKASHSSVFDYLHADEVKRVLEAKLPPKQRTAFAILAFTGARPKSLYTLTWDKVDVGGRTITYRDTKKGKDYLAHLLPPAADVLREWWLSHGRPGTGLVFAGKRGRAHTKGYDWGWADTEPYPGQPAKGYRSQIGIRRPVALYSLRHSCASHLLLGTELYTGGRTWTAEEIASHLGHDDLTTVRRYMVALGIASKKAVEETRKLLNDGGRR